MLSVNDKSTFVTGDFVQVFVQDLQLLHVWNSGTCHFGPQDIKYSIQYMYIWTVSVDPTMYDSR